MMGKKDLIISCLLLLIVLIPSIILVSCDGAVYNPANEYIDVQGTKYVSEGGYFYLEIKNIGNKTTDIVLYSVIWFEGIEWKGESFGDWGNNQASNCVDFQLPKNETKLFHFHAPYFEGNATYETFLINLEVHVNVTYIGTVKFRVVVCDLEFLQGNLDGLPKLGTYQEIWKREMDYINSIIELQIENGNLKNKLLYPDLSVETDLVLIMFVSAGFLIGFSVAQIVNKKYWRNIKHEVS